MDPSVYFRKLSFFLFLCFSKSYPCSVYCCPFVSANLYCRPRSYFHPHQHPFQIPHSHLSTSPFRICYSYLHSFLSPAIRNSLSFRNTIPFLFLTSVLICLPVFPVSATEDLQSSGSGISSLHTSSDTSVREHSALSELRTSEKSRIGVGDGNRPHANMGVTDPEGYWGRKAEGWFFYGDPRMTENGREENNGGNKEGDDDSWKKSAAYHPERIPLTTAWLRINLPRYLDLAIDNPTSQNVLAYLYLQRLVLDRSQRFSDAVREAVTGNPLLDEVSRRPVASFGAAIQDHEASLARETLLRDLKDRLSLIYVFDPGDAGSAQFSRIIGSIKDEYGIYVRAAKTGSGEDTSGFFTDAAFGGHLPDSLGIAVLPAVYVYSGSTGMIPLVQGYISSPELLDRLLLVSHREGIVSDQEYADAFPVRSSSGADLPPEFATVGTEALVQPSDLVKYFEGKYETKRNISSSDDSDR